MWCCLWMQGVAFLLRRPAIPVPSVLLTATSMCVTCLPPPPPPLSSIFSASSLRPRSCASVRLSDWCAHTLSDHTEPWWLFFFRLCESKWIQNKLLLQWGKAQRTHSRHRGAAVSWYESSVSSTCRTESRSHHGPRSLQALLLFL